MSRASVLALLALVACADGGLAGTERAVVADPVWAMHTIGTLVGADGHDMADADHDGDADIVVGGEESSTVALYLRPADPRAPWLMIGSYRHSSVEDVTFCDLDGNGRKDIASAGEDKRIRIAPVLDGAVAAPVVVAVASNLEQFTAVTCADVDDDGANDLVVGGRLGAGGVTGIYILRSPTPWIGTSWTKELVGLAGWTMHLEVQDVDGDGLLDVIAPDRLQAAPTVNGVRYWTRISGAWAAVVVAAVVNGNLPRYLDRRPGADAMLWGEVRESDQTSRLLLDGALLPFPAGRGPVQGVRLADLDDDGDLDAIWSTGEVGGVVQPTTVPGLEWLEATPAGWDLRTISGPTGGKWDEVTTLDVDADGDLDVITTEQRLGLGLVWFEQP